MTEKNLTWFQSGRDSTHYRVGVDGVVAITASELGVTVEMEHGDDQLFSVHGTGGVEPASFPCDVCDHKAKNAAGLSSHKRIKHAGGK